MRIRNIKLRIFIIFIITILVLQYVPKQLIYADSNTIKVDNLNKATVTIKQGQYYKLPNYILMNQHGKEKKMKVHWDWSTDKVDTSIAGKIITDGIVKGYNKKVAIIISIVSVNKLSITSKNKTTLVQKQKSLYPKNKRGQTYGIPIKNTSPELYPDLIPAI